MAEIKIKLTGSKTEASFAASFVTASQRKRGEAGADAYAERFFPPNYVLDATTFDVTPAERSSSRPQPPQLSAQPDDLIVLEMVGGGLLITSADRFHAGLRVAPPDLLEKLNTGFAATREGLSSLVTGLIKTISLLRLAANPADAILDAALTCSSKAISKRHAPSRMSSPGRSRRNASA
ncbi:MAG: hypothetical protein V7631_1702 [Massilia sp.]|jgi:hypothetical protein